MKLVVKLLLCERGMRMLHRRFLLLEKRVRRVRESKTMSNEGQPSRFSEHSEIEISQSIWVEIAFLLIRSELSRVLLLVNLRKPPNRRVLVCFKGQSTWHSATYSLSDSPPIVNPY